MRVFLLLLVFPIQTFACYDGYNTAYDGLCLKEYMDELLTFDDAERKCKLEESYLPMLISQEDQISFMSLFRTSGAWLDLICNGYGFVWRDGTDATYTNFQIPETCNATYANRRYYIGASGKWHSVDDGNTLSLFPICQAYTRSWTCDSYQPLTVDHDESCFLLDKNDVLLSQAEENCQSKVAHVSPIHDQKFNDYIKRVAIANRFMNGINIGLTHRNNVYVWSDGSEAYYTNFAPGFPNESLGECVVMNINPNPGQWINVDCSSELPYICTKPAMSYNESASPEGCSDANEYFPGDEIFSPTWGSATGPAHCEYSIIDPHKANNVTVEIVFFESNECCDILTIYDGLFGKKVLRRLHGYYGLTSIKVTASSNSIRMEWDASSGAHVRGWHARVI